MGDDHVPFAYKDAASGVQFQFFYEGQVVQGSSCNDTAVYLYRIKYCNGSNLTAAASLPFNRAEDCFVGVILEFEGNAVVVMVSGPAEACGIGKAVIAQHHPVNGNIRTLCKVFQSLDLLFNIFRR